MEVFCTDFGLAPSFSKVLGWLLICNPEEQPAEDIQKALHLSVGSVNAAVNVLSQIGIVRRVTFPGDRRHYYSIAADAWQTAFKARLLSLQRARDLAKKGLAFDPTNKRLIEMEAFYAWAQTTFEKVIRS